MRWASDPLGRGRAPRSRGRAMSSTAGAGREPPIGAADQLPAALMDGPVMGPTDHGQVPQVVRAAIDPVPQMMGVTPGQGPITAREDTAPIPHGQGGPLGGLDDPGRPPDLQRLGGRPTQGRGQQGGRGPQLLLQPGRVAGVGVGGEARVGTRSWVMAPSGPALPPAGCWSWRWWRLTTTRVTAASQASRRHPCGSSCPAHPRSPPRLPGRPSRLSRSTVTSSWGRTPPALGN
jgi:hypothetical protein